MHYCINTALPEDEKNVHNALNSGEDLVEWFFISSQLGCNVLTKLSSFLCSEFFYEQKKLVKFLIASVQQ